MKKNMIIGMGVMVALILVCLSVAALAATSSTTYTGECVQGTVTGTGAIINVPVGFTPRSVVVSNIVTTIPSKLEWYSGMASASALRTLATNTASQLFTRVTVSAVSAYAGSSSAAKGFTIGAEATANIAGDTIYYRACK